jgi:hypothetical protein
MNYLAQAALVVAASVCGWGRSYRRLTARKFQRRGVQRRNHAGEWAADLANRSSTNGALDAKV